MHVIVALTVAPGWNQVVGARRAVRIQGGWQRRHRVHPRGRLGAQPAVALHPEAAVTPAEVQCDAAALG